MIPFLFEGLLGLVALIVLIFVLKRKSPSAERLGHDVVPPPGAGWGSTIYTSAELMELEKKKPEPVVAAKPAPAASSTRKRTCKNCGRTDCPNAE